MKNDFELIVHSFEKPITIYPISDVHLGSLEHNSEEWEKFVEKIKSESDSYIVLAGDLMNNATRSSVSNIFDEVIRPREQKKLLIKYLKPIADKILCAVSGNHERRSIKDADDDPMYDIMCKLDLEDRYRQNIAFMKIQMGKIPCKDRNKYKSTYTFAVTHGTGGGIYTGSSVNRNERFGYTIDGLDCLIVGHTHKGTITKPAKIVIDPRNDIISIKPFTVVTSQSWMNYGGYAMQKMLLPASSSSSENGQKLWVGLKNKEIKVIW